MVGVLCNNDNNDIEPLLDLEVWWGVNPPLIYRGADEVGQSSPPSRGIGEIDPLRSIVMLPRLFAPTRLNDTWLCTPVMQVECKFRWVQNTRQPHYEMVGEDLLDGQIWTITQSVSCPSLWHLDCIIFDCDCGCDGEPTRIDTGNVGGVIEMTLGHLSARIAESVASNEPGLQYRVTVSLEN